MNKKIMVEFKKKQLIALNCGQEKAFQIDLKMEEEM
jgi:hypothetical protein